MEERTETRTVVIFSKFLSRRLGLVTMQIKHNKEMVIILCLRVRSSRSVGMCRFLIGMPMNSIMLHLKGDAYKRKGKQTLRALRASWCFFKDVLEYIQGWLMQRVFFSEKLWKSKEKEELVARTKTEHINFRHLCKLGKKNI